MSFPNRASDLRPVTANLHDLFKAGIPGCPFPNTDLIVSFAPFNNLPTQYRITVDGEQNRSVLAAAPLILTDSGLQCCG
jgi:hypothetical protein